jgi:ABC-type nitrate/sulfonate/bicarbonate transport system ATPase subunit
MLGVEQSSSPREGRAQQIAEYYLTIVGLGDAMEKRPAELSPGMRQRVGNRKGFRA